MDTASRIESKTEPACMKSLRTRLLIAWAVFIALTLSLTDIGLRFLFERSITRRTHAELDADLRQVRRSMELRPAGAIAIIREPTDPQFDIISGGRYWQVREAANVLVRSASLNGDSLPAPSRADAAGLEATHWLNGPEKQRLYAVVRDVSIQDPETGRPRLLTITTAVDAAEIAEDTNQFSNDLHMGLAVLAAFLLFGSWWHVVIGLRPLELLRVRLGAVREGRARVIEGDYPNEVMPLVTETNALLAAQEDQLQAARDRAGDLAHGLKTPLAVMSVKSRQLRHDGKTAIADEIEQQVLVMNRHVERELARVRARGASLTVHERVDVGALTDAMVSIIQGLPRGQNLRWDCEIPNHLDLAIDAEDFNTVAGNLLENAQKWAGSRISVVARKSTDGAELIVEDDGPGIPDADMERVMKRGERADESVSGSGLGLAIVRDTIELYNGSLNLSRSGLGGLRASVFWPG